MVDLVVRVRFIHLFGKVWWEFCNSIYVLRKKRGKGAWLKDLLLVEEMG